MEVLQVGECPMGECPRGQVSGGDCLNTCCEGLVFSLSRASRAVFMVSVLREKKIDLKNSIKTLLAQYEL